MDLISVLDIKDEIDDILRLSEDMKRDSKKGFFKEHLKNRTLAMIFEKSSTRTRVSFEAVMTQLGGHAIYLKSDETQLGRGETLADTAVTLSRYVDGIMIRAKRHADIVEFAANASVPVINGLSELEHPCQIISDLFTIREELGGFKGLKLAYIGDGNNVCNSLLFGCAITGIDISVATPKGYEPDEKILKDSKEISKKNGSKIEILNDPDIAVEGAEIIYTDVWISMGQENEEEKRLKDFKPYQVNMKLVEKGNNPVVMHCLPAKRGFEITDEVISSSNSVVFDQAENRLYVQKALLRFLLDEKFRMR
ncbi:MAG: ornithine carbamoyltransferase [Candidatus Hydrothermarchaeales archaeon]